VTLSSSAAREMLPALAAAWKTRIDFIGICMGRALLNGIRRSPEYHR
jgi:hypothetical protein